MSFSRGTFSREPVSGPFRFGHLAIDPPLLNASGAVDLTSPEPALRATRESVATLGAYVTKSLTARPRTGNPRPWLSRLGDGWVNSVGLANPGIAAALDEWQRPLSSLGVPVVLSLAGSGREIAEMVDLVEQGADWVDAFELNLSCPNTGAGPPGVSPAQVALLCAAVRSGTSRPFSVKLSPLDADIGSTARAAERSGADAVTAVNTMPVLAMDDAGDPLLGRLSAGMSGAPLHAIALRCVAAIRAQTELPIIGVGGVSDMSAATRMFGCGADAVGVGSVAIGRPHLLTQLSRKLSDEQVLAALPLHDCAEKSHSFPDTFIAAKSRQLQPCSSTTCGYNRPDAPSQDAEPDARSLALSANGGTAKGKRDSHAARAAQEVT